MTNTIHLFGNGTELKVIKELALDHGWKVILRTSEKFKNQFRNCERVFVIIGNQIEELLFSNKKFLPNNNDLGFSVSPPWIFKERHIKLFSKRFFNIHNQRLPLFRGAGGKSWNILMNDLRGGVSIHELTSKIDDGKIVAKKEFLYPKNLKFPTDFDKLAEKYSVKLIKAWLPKILKGSKIITVDDNEINLSEYWPRLSTETHGWINWNWNLIDIFRFCCAFSYPYEGAKTYIGNKIIKINDLDIEFNSRLFHPFQTGLIFKKYKNKIWVSHKDGTLIIKKFNFPNEIKLGMRLHTPVKKIENSFMSRIQYKPSGDLYKLN